ncbi:hypothetical protein GC101_22305 [Paenibacillus sp. LMG 31459]|uniref:Uncharacterized protein n=1 Tax=Paenibacillus phytohabitans TaxID=2654978 RepID=A0ABX1YKM8_9BACL|nr:hypothetical protein [Paenibacillus phytohabitans]NOU81598.1 hypothetical protein [Paenibacillus phytohabitans]
MAKKTKFALIILIIFVMIIFIDSMKSTTAIVQIAEINKQNITVTMELGEKVDIKVPSEFDTSEFNKTSHYLVVYKSNILQKNTLKEIHETK